MVRYTITFTCAVSAGAEIDAMLSALHVSPRVPSAWTEAWQKISSMLAVKTWVSHTQRQVPCVAQIFVPSRLPP